MKASVAVKRRMSKTPSIYPPPPFIVKSVIERAKVRLWGVRVRVVGVMYGGVVSRFKAEVY